MIDRASPVGGKRLPAIQELNFLFLRAKLSLSFRLSLPQSRTLGSKMSDNFEQLKAEYEAFIESPTQLEHELEHEITRIDELWRVFEEKRRQSEEESKRMRENLMEQVREL